MYNFFISEGHEVAFYLLQLDGKQRMDKLNITRFMYSNKQSADNFYNNTLSKLNTLQDTELKTKAITELEKIMLEIRG